MEIKSEAVIAVGAGLMILAGALFATAGFASFLHWRSEVRQEVAMAAQTRQSIAWETPGESRRLPPAPRIEQVIFMPDATASSGP